MLALIMKKSGNRLSLFSLAAVNKFKQEKERKTHSDTINLFWLSISAIISPFVLSTIVVAATQSVARNGEEIYIVTEQYKQSGEAKGNPLQEGKEALDLVDLARKITVKIEGATQGSGVIINRDGNKYTVLTAWHVIKDTSPGEELSIQTNDKLVHKVTAFKQLAKSLDLAVVEFDSAKLYTLATGYEKSKIARYTKVVVAGFPLRDPMNLHINKGSVLVHGQSKIEDGYQVLYNAETKAGMSGGPVLNQSGELIAIHGRGIEDAYASMFDGDSVKSSTGNFGIPYVYYRAHGPASLQELLVSKPMTQEDYYATLSHIRSGFGNKSQCISQASGMINAGEDALLKSIGLKIRAECFDDIGKGKEALKDIDTLIAEGIPSQFNESGLYHLRGVILEKLEMWNEAIKSYKDAVRLNPSGDSTQSLGGIASSYFNLNDIIQSREYFKKALAVSPSNKLLLYNAAVFEGATGNTKEAIRMFNTLIQLAPDNPFIYLGFGSALSKAGMYPQAIAEFSKALSIAKNSRSKLSGLENQKVTLFDEYMYDAYVSRSKAYLSSMNNDAGLSDLQNAINLLPEKHEGHYSLGIYYTNQGNKNKDAFEALSKAIKYYTATGSRKGEMHLRRAFISGRLGQWSSALEDHEVATKNANTLYNDPDNMQERGRAKFFSKDVNGAITDWSNVIDNAASSTSNKEWSYYYRGIAYSGLNSVRRACSDFYEAMARGSEGAAKYARGRYCNN
jgi:tetratricopeptide (TPR) repeat protein/S1-C subfamily serine protease